MNFSKPALLGAVLVVLIPFASADTIQLGSFASGAVAPLGDVNTALNYAGFSALSTTPSVGTAFSYLLNPATTWGPAVANSTWVGYSANSGPGGTNPALGYYTFTTVFSASAASYSGAFAVMADDTAEVILNGVVLIPFGALGTDSHCADGVLSCMVADKVPFSGILLNGGVNNNVLTFVVHQTGDFVATGSDPSGLDFNASFTSTPLGAAPEPSGLMLMGTGLMGAAGLLMLRRRGVLVRQKA